MRNSFVKVIVLIGVLANATLSHAQQGISINALANANYKGAILDLSNNNTSGTYGFLPPYVSLTNLTLLTTPITGSTPAQLSGLLVYNTSNSLSGPGLYYWNNSLTPPSWVFLGSENLIAANNGLSLSGTVAQLGGSNLIQPTSIALDGYTLSILGSSNTNTFTASGQVGIGNNTPNAKAIVDFTNSTNLGVMLPGMTAAQLPAITAAQNGLVVFNTTTGCVQYANGGVWNNLTCP